MSGGGEGAAPPAVDAVYFVVLAMLIGLATLTVSRAWPARWPALPIPFTAWLLVFGLAFGFANEAGDPGGPLAGGITAWTSINDKLIFAVFLPVLAFGSSMNIEVHKLARQWVAIGALAIGGTLFNAALIAIVARYVLPFDWSWSEATLLGSILSATDPVAVVALMESVGASAQLATVIEGESLLNDGVAYVLFQVVVKWQSGEDLTAGDVVGFTFKASLGGIGMGLAFGLGAIAWLLLLVGEDAVAEAWIVLLTSYACFLVSDELLGMSGMLALVFCGILMAAAGSAYIRSRSRPSIQFFWRWADWTANTLIFFLAGAITAAMVYRSSTISAVDLGWAVALWALLLAIRAAGVALLWPLLARTGYRMKWRDGVVLSWGGLRGAVGLVLALSVRNDAALGSLEFRELVFFLTSLQAALTVLVQGSLMQPLLRFLGFLDLGPARKATYRLAASAVEQYGQMLEAGMRYGGKGPWQQVLGPPDWDRVKAAIALGIQSLVDARPGKAGDAAPSLEEWTENLRERVLGLSLGCYDEMSAARFLSPPVYSSLKESNEAAEDFVDTRLAGWDSLLERMRWLPRLEALNRRLPRWATLGWLRVLTARAAQRQVAATTAFILAQRYIARQLAALEAGEEAAKSTDKLQRAATLDYHPLFLSDVGSIDHTHRDALLSDVMQRGAAAAASRDDGPTLQAANDAVRAEVAAAEAAAREHLKAVCSRHPDAAKEVVTLQMAIALLDRKVDLLAALQSAGMLEAREAEQAMELAVRRIQAVRFLHRM